MCDKKHKAQTHICYVISLETALRRIPIWFADLHRKHNAIPFLRTTLDMPRYVGHRSIDNREPRKVLTISKWSPDIAKS